MKFKRVLLLDAETRWSQGDYTLSKMTTEEYIRDPRFKAFGFCYKWADTNAAPQWVTHADLPRFFASIDWSTTAVMAHNAMFDASILSWVYGHKPAFIIDTLSMARALRGADGGNSLAKLAEDFGLPPKGRAVHSTSGLDELTPEIEAELAAYCVHDVVLLEGVFNALQGLAGPKGFPVKELHIIDMVMRMYVDPQIELDEKMLLDALAEEHSVRSALLARLKMTDADLASDARFAEILRTLGVEPPTKISKTTGKESFAFAKNDAMFQAMLQHDNEEVVLLCEARMRVKSTQARTRAQRFADIASRGALPVPLYYSAAHTHRIQAAKGQGLNMQNLKRGSFLRRALMAPFGYTFVVVDLSQIEPRVLAWLTGYDWLLDIFRSGKDAYALFGAQMFGIPGLSKETHPDLRQAAKSAMLGCFGPDTPVLTDRGWVPIVRVQATDLVWDGVEWVCHQGVKAQGEKEVLTAHGISATSDHEILTGHGWQEWGAVLTSRSLFRSALSSASLSALGGRATPAATTQQCGAAAGGWGGWTGTACSADQPRAATPAPSASRWLQERQPEGSRPYARTAYTGTDSSIASAPSLFGARTRAVLRTLITAAEGSLFTLRGWLIGASSCATSLAYPAGIKQSYSWTASTISAVTSRATFASARAASTWRTSGASQRAMSKNSSGASQPLRQRMQTYDIVCAGPRNRYTVLTDAGPIVVHNCGFGMGWAAFAGQLLTGFMGAPPMRYGKAFAKQLGVTARHVQRFVEYAPNVERLLEIPHTCTTEQLLIHAVCAQEIINRYREAAAPVKKFWDTCSSLIASSLHGGQEYDLKCVHFEEGRIVLPSGLSLRYPNLGATLDARGRQQWSYGQPEDYSGAKVKRERLYGGKLTENIVQAVARCVMTDGMLRIQKRYPCVLTVHDETVVLVPTVEVEEAEPWVLEQMTKVPAYMPGIPLAADTGTGVRYGDAKN